MEKFNYYKINGKPIFYIFQANDPIKIELKNKLIIFYHIQFCQ